MDATENNATQGAPADNERTFTQAEMDAIIGDRLKRERAKYADYDELKGKAAAYDEAAEASKSELQKATERAAKAEQELADYMAKAELAKAKSEIATAHGVPAELLRGNTSEELNAHAEAIKSAFASVSKYPDVSDNGDGKSSSVMTKEEIMNIKNGPERIRMMAAHKELFG